MNPNDSQKTHSLQTLQMADDQFNKAVNRVNKQSYITIFQRPSRILFEQICARATNQFAFSPRGIGSALVCSLDIQKGF